METYLKARRKLDRDLLKTRDDVVRLSYLVDSALDRALRCLRDHDEFLARQIIPDDTAINAARYQIEQDCYTLLATQQPTARDMRALIAAVHIAIELERIGDHAAGIARWMMKLTQHSVLLPPQEFLKMGLITRQMLKSSFDAYVNGDVALAQSVVARDAEVDQLNQKIHAELVALMLKDSHNINRATQLTWVAHDLERAADHITNICERVIFQVTGQMVEEKEG